MLDFELEVAVVIGRDGASLSPDEAREHIFGYTVLNDWSARDLQRREMKVMLGPAKGKDSTTTLGPWLVTADEVGDPQDLEMFLNLNGRRMQSGNTKRMIFPVRHLIAYVSQFMTLYAGDLLITGTPPGVGLGHKPDPLFLRPGDEMHLGIEKLGEQRQRVIAWRHLGDASLP